MKKSNRIVYYNQYDKFYRDHKSIGSGSCYYCGEPESSLDHVPALSWAASGSLGEEHKLFRVASCLECNLKLGGKALHTIPARQEYLAASYYKEFKRLPEFTSADLEELGPNLFQLRAQSMLRKANLADRLRWIRKHLRE